VVSGHTAFSKNGLFSGGINYADISKKYPGMVELVGFTLDGIKKHFKE